MAELVFFRRNEELMRLGLDARTLTVGRAESNDVVIPDPAVSRAQFSIEPLAEGHRLVDRSGRGTELAGALHEEATLADGMDVALGQWRVVYRLGERGSEVEEASIVAGRTALAPADGHLAPPPHGARLRIESNGMVGFRPLVDALEVGSADRCGVRLDDPFVSARHAWFERRGGRFVVRDLDSRNGVFIGAIRVWEAEVPFEAPVRVGQSELSIVGPDATDSAGEFEGMIGDDPAMRRVFDLIDRVASSHASVAVFGESGTGKELVAQALHRRSARSRGAFIPINCGALSPELVESELFGHEKGAFTGAERLRKGAFEEANGGTLFLDEIGELPLPLQAKLLRALELGEVKRVGASRPITVDVRIVAATNRDLRAEVKKGTFREDLYWRLSAIPIALPPLRARRGDIKALVARFLSLYAPRDLKITLTPAAEKRLVDHDWPGNIRELKNTVHRLLLLRRSNPIEAGEIVFERDFGASCAAESGVGSDPDIDDTTRVYIVGKPLERIEDEVFVKTCRRVGTRASFVARELGQSRGAVYRRLEKLGMSPGGDPQEEGADEV